jgi:diguanylate cyclase (GGDEF)-like protein
LGLSFQFDIRSAIMIGACLNVLIALMLLTVRSALPIAYKNSLRWWWLGLLMQPMGFVLIALRGVLPEFISIVLANTIIAFAVACFSIAMRTFTGIPLRRGYAFSLVALATVFAGYFSIVQDLITVRIISLSFIHAALLIYGARGAYRNDASMTVVSRVLMILFLFSALMMASRGVYELLAKNPVSEVFSLHWTNVMSYGMGSLLPIIGSIGFLLMCTEDSQKRLERAASEDPLTGIYNRRALAEFGLNEFARSRRHGSPLSVILLDIDFFKTINDELGHQAGDNALVETVRRLKAIIRREDYLGRMGGEEFIILLPDTNAAQAMVTAERIQQVFSTEPMLLRNQKRIVTLSGGVTLLSSHDQLFDDVLRRADQAMYLAKMMGRNRMQLDPLLTYDLP